MNYYSQAGQDKWVHDQIGDKGFFVDVGAYDGIQTSNTFALENLGWKGICIEANAEVFKLLNQNRKSINVNKAITNYKGTCLFGHDRIGGSIPVGCDILSNILDDNNIAQNIDYLSMDIEGAELIALEAFDFSKYTFKLMTIEHNLYIEGPERKEKIFRLLTSRGYERVVEDAKCLDPNPLYYMQPYEDWYANKLFV